MIQKKKIIGLIIVIAGVVAVLVTTLFFYNKERLKLIKSAAEDAAVHATIQNSGPWLLGIYGNDQTILRTNYDSKDACLSAGRAYLADGIAERFDCGYQCTSFEGSGLQDSPFCQSVCNDAGCR